jgi:hypothetical protein
MMVEEMRIPVGVGGEERDFFCFIDAVEHVSTYLCYRLTYTGNKHAAHSLMRRFVSR